jgi:laccase
MFITASINSLYCSQDSGPDCVNIRVATSVNNLSWVNPSTDILQSYYRYCTY